MSDSPWIKFYASDWLAGTSGLTAAERGVYITILALIYENEGPIQLDAGRLARRCGITKAAFGRAFDALCGEGKLTITDGNISNRRSEKELSERAIRSQKASASANQRWSAPSEKSEQKQQPEHANASAKQCASDANQKPEPELEKKDTYVSQKKARPKSRLPDEWHPGDTGVFYAIEQGIPEELVNDEISGFRAYWRDRTDRDGSKSQEGWIQCWQGHCRRNGPILQRSRSMAKQAGPQRYGQGGSIASIVARRRADGSV